ncbi:CRISPR-associated protein CXXC-CXXC [Arabidopsis thaliana x Arabidopsis arenosa]|uniref:CRISPR-associated protein CXXC-CXXC n=1 Tax=Arabidopsis thaliana x Arabidopsis arenosa TaxID=1240361 RepID=A0A8T2CC81_9BRAS|nr:CRISPR-associated protein CXXC-CXXC [Arabidopsis thaliana x Arabidopsis arenosa]
MYIICLLIIDKIYKEKLLLNFTLESSYEINVFTPFKVDLILKKAEVNIYLGHSRIIVLSIFFNSTRQIQKLLSYPCLRFKIRFVFWVVSTPSNVSDTLLSIFGIFVLFFSS